MKRNTRILAALLFVLLSSSALQVGSTLVRAETQGQSAGSQGLFYVLVNSTIYSGIESSLTQYVADLESEGYNVSIYTISKENGTAEDIRSFLNSSLQEGLVGALFVGDSPHATYEEIPIDLRALPCDLFYMDLDGNWTDSDGDGIYDGHSGDVEPEIYIGRLKASNINGTEVSMINDYFEKVHSYRNGTLSLPKRALVYTDARGEEGHISAAERDNLALKAVYDETTLVNDPAITNATDYKKRITEGDGYEWVHPLSHGTPGGHCFTNSSGECERISSEDYRDMNPKAMFYQFSSCNIARYTSTDNVAGTIVFATSYALLVVGSTRMTSLLSWDNFYGAVSQGKSIGTALQEWYTEYTNDKGWTIIGDPTLHVVESGERVHDVAVTSVAPSTYQAKIGDPVTITVGVENQGNKNETFKVSTYYDGKIIGTKTVTNLAVNDSTTLTFTWNTIGMSSGFYTIKTVATVVGDIDPDDNTMIDGVVEVRLPRGTENVIENSGWETGDNSFWEVSITKETLSQVSYEVNQNSGINGTFGFHVDMHSVWRWRTGYTSQSLINYQELNDALLDADTKLNYWIYPDYILYQTTRIPEVRWEVILFFSTGNKLHYYDCLNMPPIENSTDKYVLTLLNLGEWNQILDNSVLTTYTSKFGKPQSDTSIVKIAVYVKSRTYVSWNVYNTVIANFDSNQANGGLQIGRPVQNVDTGLSYLTIQEAIDAPETLDGHTIQVYVGTYYENVVVTKALTLIGEDLGRTVIDGGGLGGEDVFTIQADNVYIRKFTIQNGRYGVYLFHSENSVVSRNMILNNVYGVCLNTSSNNVVKGNTIASSSNGIFLWNCSENSLYGNFIEIDVDGIFLWSSSGNILRCNTVTNATYGIKLLDSSSNNTIAENLLSYNVYGIYLNASSNNTIHHNNFVDNTVQAYLYESYNTAWISINFVGNYWSDYSSPDGECNGIGYTTYLIDENNKDNYPLMWKWLPGDLYGDGNVGKYDIGIFYIAYVSHVGDEKYNPACDFEEGDGDVDSVDMAIFNAAYPSEEGDPNWDPRCDLVGDEPDSPPDGDVDKFDYVVFGEACGSCVGDEDYNPACDLDEGDGDVDKFDYGIFTDAYRSEEGDPNWDPRCDLVGDEPDSPPDGDVDKFDYGVFADAYGSKGDPRYKKLADLDYDGDVDSVDEAIFNQAYEGTVPGSNPNYNPDCDFDKDGDVDSVDMAIFNAAYPSEEGDPNWDPRCDLVGDEPDSPPDGDVDPFDYGVFADAYGSEV